MLGRIGVLRVSSGCLNKGSCSFHLVATRKTRVAGCCKGELLFFVIHVGAYVIGSWRFHLVGVGTLRDSVILLVGVRETRELVLPSSRC